MGMTRIRTFGLVMLAVLLAELMVFIVHCSFTETDDYVDMVIECQKLVNEYETLGELKEELKEMLF